MNSKKIIAFMLSLAILYPMGGTAIKDVTNTITASATSESSTPTDESSFTFDSSTGTITKYTGTDASVVIPDTIGGVKVTAIGEEAFYECETLKDITISDNVTYIGVSAFYSCTALENITLSQNLTSIDNGAFSKCSALTSMTIPDSVTYIGKYGISNCTELKDITLSKNLTSISEYTFSGCQSLESITIPDSVTSLGTGVFWYCEKLKDVTLSKNLTSIGEDVFCNAVFTEIEIPSSVTTIKEEAFYHCEKLSSITIPKNVTSIDDKAFVGCNSLKTVYICSKSIDTSNLKIFDDYTEPQSIFTFDEDTGTITKYTGTATEIVIPDTIDGVKVTTIGQDAFRECTSLTNIKFPDSVTSFSESSFYGCTALTDITLPDSLTKTGNNAFGGCTNLKTVTFGKNSKLKSVDYGAFMSCTSLTSINLPNTVDMISMYAFKDCTSLTNITIPDSVTSFSESSFYGCTALTDITLPDSLTKTGNNAFRGCTNLKTVTFGKNSKLKSVDYGAFMGCTSLTSINLPNTVDMISMYAFKDCTSLTNITIPDSVTSIGNSAFAYTGLTSITLPENLTSIGDDVFYSCVGLTSITIPNSVTSIGEYAFGHCTELTSITLPENLTSIGNAVFESCIGLTHINIPENVTSIGEYAFYSCEKLTNITLPKDLTSIGNSAFAYTGLTSITLPENLTSIGNDAFYSCVGLTSITIPKNVTSVGNDAFGNCGNLQTIIVDRLKSDCTEFGLPEETDTLKIYYNVKINSSLKSITSSNIDNEISSYNGYTTTLTADTGYTLPDSVTVKVGDTVLEDGYTFENGILTIPKESLTDNVTIEATATLNEYKVTSNLENIESDGAEVVSHGKEYKATLTADTGYTLPDSVTVTVGDTVLKDGYTFKDGVLTIGADKVTGDITIEATATLNEYKVTSNLENIKSDGAEVVSHGKEYKATLTADTGYTLPDSVTVTVGDTVLKDGYTFKDGVLTIGADKVTGDITIEATAILNEYKVTSNLENIESDGAEVAPHGKEYKATLTADTGYTLPDSVTVKVGDTVLKDGYTFKDGVLTIGADKVTGNITITANGVKEKGVEPVQPTKYSSVDLLRLKKHVLGISKIEDITPYDLAKDNTLNVFDVIALKERLLKG